MKLISRVVRGVAIESFHVGYAVAINHKRELIFACGEPDYPVWIRSAAKPFQTAAMLEIGIKEEFGLTSQDIAIISASHNGEEEHITQVQGILKKIDMGVEDLKCGVHPPIDPAAHNVLILKGSRPSALHNNCSGKHSGMLAASKKLEISTENYLDPNHPVQQRILEKIKYYSEQEKIPIGIDGCSAPVFFLALRNIALMYQKLAAAEDPFLKEVRDAMTGNPYLVAGRNRFDTNIMSASNGKIIAKAGAEGVRGIGVITEEGSVGIALKVLDGNKRCSASMIIAILKELKLIDDNTLSKLSTYEKVTLKNHAGLEVGYIDTILEE